MGLRDTLATRPIKRLLGLVLLCGIILVGGRLLVRGPVAVDVVYELGPDARGIRVLTATYRADNPDGRMALRKRLSFGAAGASETEHHLVRLPRGTYALALEVERDGGTEALSRTIEIQGDGDVLRIVAHK
jgi:hypothetical protein